MPKFISYRCPDCSGTFRHLQHPSDAPPPDRCPLCGSWVATDRPPEPVFVPQAPLIRESPYARSIDQVYRNEERASIDRAEEAAGHLEDIYRAQGKIDGPERNLVEEAQRLELAGLKSGLKITDMKDPTSMREGDAAAVTKTPPSLAVNGAQAGFQNLGGMPPTAGVAGVGEAIRAHLTPGHAQRAQQMTARGQMAPTYIDRR